MPEQFQVLVLPQLLEAIENAQKAKTVIVLMTQ